MDYAQLKFSNARHPKDYDAFAEFGITKNLYRVFTDNVGVIRVMYDGSVISIDERFDNIFRAQLFAQNHYEGLCTKIMDAITR